MGLSSGSGDTLRVSLCCEPAVLEEHEVLQHRTLWTSLQSVLLSVEKL